MPTSQFHTKRGGFTLAELLVVIAIIGIIFAIALPNLTGITGQSRLEGAANAVHSATKLARQHAIANNQPTYLVFQDDQSTTNANLAFRAYAVFSINIHTNPVDQSAGYFLTDWETLPEGIVFDSLSSEDMNNVFTPRAEPWQGGFNQNRLLYIDPEVHVVLGFKPGGAQFLDHRNDIHLAEGFYEAGRLVRSSGQGKRIRIDATGTSYISDIRYSELGEPEVISR